MIKWRIFCQIVLMVFCSFDMRIRANHLDVSVHTHPSQQHGVVYIFAHGLGANKNQGIDLLLPESKVLKNNEWIVHYPSVFFNFPDAKHEPGDYDRAKVNLAQQDDCQRLKEVYRKVRTDYPDHTIVLVGISRGAATILKVASQEQLDNLGALVLESPFDTLSSIIDHLLRRFCVQWVPFAEHMARAICKKHFPNIDIQGTFPIDVAHQLPKEIPVLFIHSKKDKVVPLNSSRLLYSKLINNGHTDAYLLELNAGLHGKLVQGPDKDCYLFAVQAFYKKYGLPHEPDMAQRGHYILESARPNIEEVYNALQKRVSYADESTEHEDMICACNAIQQDALWHYV